MRIDSVAAQIDRGSKTEQTQHSYPTIVRFDETFRQRLDVW